MMAYPAGYPAARPPRALRAVPVGVPSRPADPPQHIVEWAIRDRLDPTVILRRPDEAAASPSASLAGDEGRWEAVSRTVTPWAVAPPEA